jgi:uncharacterized protein (TIGR03086 family)
MSEQTDDGLATLAEAAAHFGQVLAQVQPDQAAGPTPCDDWSVTDLVEHVTGGNHWAALILRGAKAGEAMAQVKAGAFTGDSNADYLAATKAQQAAFDEAGALGRTVDHFIGPVPAARFLGMRTGDLLIHSWDLARAIGADERLPEPLVRAGLAIYEPMADRLAASGMFGSGAQGAPPAQTPQDRLLQLTGRRP